MLSTSRWSQYESQSLRPRPPPLKRQKIPQLCENDVSQRIIKFQYQMPGCRMIAEQAGNYDCCNLRYSIDNERSFAILAYKIYYWFALKRCNNAGLRNYLINICGAMQQMNVVPTTQSISIAHSTTESLNQAVQLLNALHFVTYNTSEWNFIPTKITIPQGLTAPPGDGGVLQQNPIYRANIVKSFIESIQNPFHVIMIVDDMHDISNVNFTGHGNVTFIVVNPTASTYVTTCALLPSVIRNNMRFNHTRWMVVGAFPTELHEPAFNPVVATNQVVDAVVQALIYFSSHVLNSRFEIQKIYFTYAQYQSIIQQLHLHHDVHQENSTVRELNSEQWFHTYIKNSIDGNVFHTQIFYYSDTLICTNYPIVGTIPSPWHTELYARHQTLL